VLMPETYPSNRRSRLDFGLNVDVGRLTSASLHGCLGGLSRSHGGTTFVMNPAPPSSLRPINPTPIRPLREVTRHSAS
jgi:hypothetical protein